MYKNNHKLDNFKMLAVEIDKMSNKIADELNKIETALGKDARHNKMEMSVIFEEETERSVPGDENQERGDDLYYEGFCRENLEKMKKIDGKLEKLLKIYSDQLYSICQEVTKWESKNQQIKKKYKEIKLKYTDLSTQNQQLKDQITTLSSEYLINNKNNQQYEYLFASPKNKKKQPPKQNIPTNIDLPQKQQALQQQKKNTMKWKQLSKKVNQLKQKLFTYEQQISQKDDQIRELRSQFQRKEREFVEDQEKRKLKKSNTNLRGEKTVLNNQIAALKKAIYDKNQVVEVYQKQITSYKEQIASLQQTITFQGDLIKDMKLSIAKKQQEQNLHKTSSQVNTQRCIQYESQFYEFLVQQQHNLQQFYKYLDKIQEKYEIKARKAQQQIIDLHTILDQKNQSIMKLKTQGRELRNQDSISNQNAYYMELVKNLSKKIAEKDDLIYKLSNSYNQ